MGCIWEVHDSVNMQALLDLEATHTQGYDAVHNHVILFLHCVSAYISLFPGCSGRLPSCVAPLGIYPGNKKLLLSVPSPPPISFITYLEGGTEVRRQLSGVISHLAVLGARFLCFKLGLSHPIFCVRSGDQAQIVRPTRCGRPDSPEE